MKALYVSALVLIFSFLGGLAAASGSTLVIVAFSGITISLFLFFSPSILFLTTLIFSMAVAGLLDFYLGIGIANWIPSVLGLALIPASIIFQDRSLRSLDPKSRSHFDWLIGLYMVVLASSSFLNQNSWTQVVVGIRNYWPFIGVYFALQTFAGSDHDLRRWVRALLFIGLIQFPFVLHQAIFVAPKRISSFEAVGGGVESLVGTFGGNQLGGGYTGEMAVFVLLTSCLALALAKQIRHGLTIAWTMCILALGCVALAETKVVFVLAPIALIIVFFEEIKSSPKKIMGLLLAMTVSLGGLVAIYLSRLAEKGPIDLGRTLGYSFDPTFMVDRWHRGRTAALIHWWENNITQFDPVQALLGHGMASTLETSRIIGEGSAVLKYGLGLDSHAASRLLWDTGLIGFGIFFLIIVRTAWHAHILIRGSHVVGFHLSVLKVARAAMVCFAAMLPYQVSVLGGAPMQFIFWFFVGYVEVCRRMAPIGETNVSNRRATKPVNRIQSSRSSIRV
jgi:hypothetical protein